MRKPDIVAPLAPACHAPPAAPGARGGEIEKGPRGLDVLLDPAALFARHLPRDAVATASATS